MMEQFCVPCGEKEEFRPEEIGEVELCPCPVPDVPITTHMPRQYSIEVETDCYSDMIKKMTSTFHCQPFNAC